MSPPSRFAVEPSSMRDPSGEIRVSDAGYRKRQGKRMLFMGLLFVGLVVGMGYQGGYFATLWESGDPVLMVLGALFLVFAGLTPLMGLMQIGRRTIFILSPELERVRVERRLFGLLRASDEIDLVELDPEVRAAMVELAGELRAERPEELAPPPSEPLFAGVIPVQVRVLLGGSVRRLAHLTPRERPVPLQTAIHPEALVINGTYPVRRLQGLGAIIPFFPPRESVYLHDVRVSVDSGLVEATKIGRRGFELTYLPAPSVLAEFPRAKEVRLRLSPGPDDAAAVEEALHAMTAAGEERRGSTEHMALILGRRPAPPPAPAATSPAGGAGSSAIPTFLALLLLLPARGRAEDRTFLQGLGSAACAATHRDEGIDLDPSGDPDPFAGPLARRHLPPDRSADLLHLQGDVEVLPGKGSITGTVTLSFTPTAEPLKTLRLHAGRRLVIHEARDEQGRTLVFRHDDERLEVDLAAPLDRGRRARVTIRYSGKPKEGLFFVRAKVAGKEIPEAWTQGETSYNRDWIPLWDYPNDRFSTEMTVRVPEAYTVVGNGLLVSEKLDRGQRVLHYRQDKAHVGYLLSLSIGRFAIRKDDSFGKVPLWYVVYPEDLPKVDRTLARTPEVLRTLESLSGVPYPWAKYSQTVASAYPIGGMENVSATTLGRAYAVYGASASLTYDGIGLIAHEAAHQWYGDLLTCRDWANLWLNEGFASYFEGLYLERAEGRDRADEDVQGLLRWYLGEAGRYTRPIVTYVFDAPGSMFDAHTYAKGAWVLRMLRAKLGDELFFRGIHAYTRDHAGGLVETADLLRSMEKATGRNLHAFFDQWIFRAGHPKIEVTIADKEKDRQVRVRIVQTTETPFSFPLTLRVVYPKGVPDSHRVHVDGKEQVVYLPRRMRPSFVEVDPQGMLLKELVLDAPSAMLRAEAEHGATTWGRTDAVRVLGKRGDDLANVSALDRVLNGAGAYRSVRSAAAKALGKVASPEACAALRKGLDAGEARVRRAAARALKKCRHKTTASALRSTVRRDPSISVVAAALASLGAQKDPPRSVLLGHLGKRSWEETVAGGAVRGLANARKPWALKALIKVLKDEGAPSKVRQAVLRSARDVVDHDPSAAERLLPAVRPLVKDDDPFLIRASLRTLTRIGTADDIATLEEGIRRLPEKWYHKEVSRMRRRLRRRVADLRSEGESKQRVRKLEERIEELEGRLKDIEAKSSARGK